MTNHNVELISGSTVEATFYNRKDIKNLSHFYKMWVAMNDFSKKYNFRKINLPEVISEIVACYSFGLGRTNNVVGSLRDSFSMDAVSHDGHKYQIKGSSYEGGTLNSFSPNSNFDFVIIVDAFNEGKWDGSMVLYLIKCNLSKIKVNNQETFEQQQKQKRRPRFNLLAKVLKGEIKTIDKKDFKFKLI